MLLIPSIAFAADYDGDKKSNELDAHGGSVASTTKIFVPDPVDVDIITTATFQELVTAVLGASYDTPAELTALLGGKQDASAVLDTYASIDPSADVQSLLGAADSDALVTLLGLVAGDIPDLSATYEAKDAEILRADTADTIGATIGWADGQVAFFGGTNASYDIGVSWDTDLSDDDAGDNDFAADTFTTAGLKLNANSASDIPILFNNAGTGGISLYVDKIYYSGSVNYVGSENFVVGLDANAGGVSPTASEYELYFDAGVFKWNESGSEKTAAKLEDAQTFTGAKTFNSLYLENGATSAGFARFYEDTDDGSNYVTVQAQGITANYTLTLPTDDGDNGEALLTNGTGGLSWGSPSASAGGSDTQVQFNSGGSTLAGDAGFIFTAATDTLTLGEDGQDGSLVLYNELGGTDYNHTISVNANQTGAITSTLPSTTGTLMNNALTNTYLFVGSAGGVATGVQMSGDATLANTGAVTIANDAVTFAKLDDDGNFGPFTGAWDFTGGSLEVPNGANPTVNAAGEVAVDSDDDTVRFYTDAVFSIPGVIAGPPVVVKDPDADSDYAIFRAPYNITIVAVHYLSEGGTSWTGQLQEADADGDSGADTQAADTAAAAGTTTNVTSFSNATIDAGDWVMLKTTSISGTPTSVSVSFEYTVDAVD